MTEPTQPSLRRMRAFGIKPNRELGQNFLIDSNILDVIGRAADLTGQDVVLEAVQEYVNDFAERLNGIATLDGLTQAFHEAIADLGFDAFALHIVSLSGIPGRVVYGVTTYPEEWVERYREAGYVQIDPVISNGLTRQMPFDSRAGVARVPVSRPTRSTVPSCASSSCSSSPTSAIGTWRASTRRSIGSLIG